MARNNRGPESISYFLNNLKPFGASDATRRSAKARPLAAAAAPDPARAARTVVEMVLLSTAEPLAPGDALARSELDETAFASALESLRNDGFLQEEGDRLALSADGRRAALEARRRLLSL